MAQKIFNNGSDGKILMSSAGKIIRQPYEFGSAFQNKMGLNNYIEITISISSEFTLLNWFYNSIFSTDASIYTPISNFTDSINDNYIRSIWEYSAWYDNFKKNSRDIGNQIAISNTRNKLHLSGQGINSLGNYIFLSNQQYLTGTTTIIPTLPITKVWVAAFRESNGTTPSRYAKAEDMYSRVTIFNRLISQSEYLYYYNNNIGSDFQSMNGIIVDIKMNIAEILNIGGSDFVGVRDYSGNNHHGQIMNLPPGDIYTQLAYANANLFVPFLT